MDRASDAPVVASAGTQAEPRTPASWLLSAGRFQTAAPLPVGSDPRSVPRTEPVHIAPLPSSPALGRYAKGLPAAVILLRRNRTDRPPNEGFLLRRNRPDRPLNEGFLLRLLQDWLHAAAHNLRFAYKLKGKITIEIERQAV